MVKRDVLVYALSLTALSVGGWQLVEPKVTTHASRECRSTSSNCSGTQYCCIPKPSQAACSPGDSSSYCETSC